MLQVVFSMQISPWKHITKIWPLECFINHFKFWDQICVIKFEITLDMPRTKKKNTLLVHHNLSWTFAGISKPDVASLIYNYTVTWCLEADSQIHNWWVLFSCHRQRENFQCQYTVFSYVNPKFSCIIPPYSLNQNQTLCNKSSYRLTLRCSHTLDTALETLEINIYSIIAHPYCMAMFY